MKMSENGLITLREREGARNKAYQDVKGIWTIGVGHTGPEVVKGLYWTDEQIEAQLALDVQKAEECILNNVRVGLTQNQFDALCSFIFNVGTHAFEQSTMLKLINKGDFDGAAQQFNHWVIPISVTSRRMSEKAQFSQT
jgi:lysozyme